MLKLYNTLSRKKEVFKPIRAGKVSMYSCGPTVYNVPHIGNWRSFIFSDILKRYLIFSGYKVTHVMNLTDVDDKTIKGARQEGIALKEFTERYEKLFFDDLKQLNILPADRFPRATEFIGEMQQLINKLMKKGYAYQADDGSTYFSISRFKDYGKLANLKVKDLKAGARVSQDEYEKRSARDFALWKAHTEDDGDVFWDSPFGKGRPGWHMECSAMSLKLLGQVDIHTGGVDLVFPHHQNEIAQSEAATGRKFVNYWVHCEHLIVEGKKMSKSLGNFLTLEDAIDKGYPAKAVRFLLMATHYRQQLNFTFNGLDYAKNTLERLEDFMRRTKEGAGAGQATAGILSVIGRAEDRFRKVMDDDLNMSEALAVMHEFTNKINSSELTPADNQAVLEFMEKIDSVLGILDVEEQTLPKELLNLIKEREEARKQKDFKKADVLRERLKKKGVLLDDTKQGTRWKISL
ncbi:MAG: cysteine--tRNA ligase [Nanoarchaeota archaeon]|nr:cysteine--tRNA ligase [Nanoarchaeota archaeon]